MLRREVLKKELNKNVIAIDTKKNPIICFDIPNLRSGYVITYSTCVNYGMIIIATTIGLS